MLASSTGLAVQIKQDARAFVSVFTQLSFS